MPAKYSWSLALLNDVRQLMGQKILARPRLRIELAGIKDQILANRVGVGVQGAGGFGGVATGMNTYLTEISLEATFKIAPQVIRYGAAFTGKVMHRLEEGGHGPTADGFLEIQDLACPG